MRNADFFVERGNGITKEGRMFCPPFIFISKRNKKKEVRN